MANALQYNSPDLAVNMGLVIDGQGVDTVLGTSTSNPIALSLGLADATSPHISMENKKRERSEHWHRNETIALINFYKSHKAEGGKPKKKPRDLWEAIASQMQEAGYIRNQEHCRNRWKVLCRDFKNSKDQGELECGKRYKYYDDMSSALEVHYSHHHIEPTPPIMSPSPSPQSSVKFTNSIADMHDKTDLLSSNYLMTASSHIQSPSSLANNKTKVALIYEGRRIPQKLVIYPNSSSVDLESTIRTLCRIPGNKGILLLDDEGDAVPISNVLPNGEVFTVAVLDDNRYRGELTLDNPHPNDLMMVSQLIQYQQ
ncbi:Zinc finger protein with KRAB and SCAN domains [Basidiobolus ranarum]|uniref:Zinc finger protein with KRAB and SCAN domains n=1 Tax=Basidiobolus ranarum TaxID=34480 RepID=A0ABR2WQA9_9FUNG